jgi:TolB protein
LTGTIKVTVSATGTDAPATYNVFVTGVSGPVTTTAGSVVLSLAPGGYSVRLALTVNCEVAGDNPRSASVVVGDTTTVSFAVTCTAAYGAIRVTTATSGVEIDGNGYAVRLEAYTIDGRSYQEMVSIPTAGEVTLEHVVGGSWYVTLVGLAVNCNPEGVNRRSVAVTPAQTTAVTYDVVCVAGTPQLAYVTGDGRTQEIKVANVDGTADRALTSDDFTDDQPSWSPDGSRLAFTSVRDGNSDIYVMNADGSNVVRLTNDPNPDDRPAWSPDGTRIAFVSTRAGNADIFVMNADGSGVTRLTSSDSSDTDPAWSPDGRRMAFTSTRSGRAEVYVMDATGAGATKITLDGGRQPAWSPDGNSLAFVVPVCYGFYGCESAVFVTGLGAQGGVSRVLEPAEHPTWSPDGRRLAVDRLLCDFYDIQCVPDGIYIVTVDGGDASRALFGKSGAWRPRVQP